MQRLIALLLICVSTGVLHAQQPLQSRLMKVALFKQGYGVMVREVVLPAGEAESVIADVPVPVHGTFWLVTPPGVTVKSVLAQQGMHPVPVSAVSIPELLRANIGEVIEVKSEEGWEYGTLLSVAENRVTEHRSYTEMPAHHFSLGNLELSAVEQANLIVMQSEDGITALPLSAVRQVRKRPGDGALKTSLVRQEPGAEMRISSTGNGGIVQIAYITRGITWAPSYRLDLMEKTARLSGKAVIVNDVEDIETRELSCVTGFPNMKFAHVIDPLALKETLPQFLASLQSSGEIARPGAMTQMVTMNSADAPVGGMPALPAVDDNPDDVSFYRFNDIRLQDGDRLYLPMFDLDVPYTDVYRWNVREEHSGHSSYVDERSGMPEAEDVWHAVILKHTGNMPWTTAPIMIMRNGEYLGQDMLTYTSSGSETLVNITKAVDVKADMEERTIERGELVTIAHRKYQKFILRGRLSIANYKPAPVRMLITKSLVGDIIETSVKPKSVSESPREDVANAERIIVWEVGVPAGKSMEIDYTYKIFLPAD